MKRNVLLRAFIVVAIMIAAGSPHLQAQSPASSTPHQALFSEGRNLWDDGRFSEAEKKFREALTKHPRAKMSDRTAYYLITTLVTLGRAAEARREIQNFNRNYPQSRWQSDVEEKRIALTGTPQLHGSRSGQRHIEVNVPSVFVPYPFPAKFGISTPFGPAMPLHVNVSPSLDQEILRVIIDRDPDTGIEIARQRFKGNPSDPAVITNLSVIAGSGSAQAMPFLVNVAGSAASPNAKSMAVFFMFQDHNKAAAEKVVVEILKDKEAIPAVADALGRFNMNERRVVLERIAQSPLAEKTYVLQGIYKTSVNTQVRSQVVATAGSIPDAAALAFLNDVVRNEKEPAVREVAIQNLTVRSDTDVKVLVDVLKSRPAPTRARSK